MSYAGPGGKSRGWWYLYVCSCGGYGHNNMSIHLKDGCDPRKVERVTVVPKGTPETEEGP